MKRVYPRNVNDGLMTPGTQVEADLMTTICRTPNKDADCKDFQIATIVLTVPRDGPATVEVRHQETGQND